MNTNTEDRIVQYLSGNMSEVDSAAFDAEIASNENLRDSFLEYETIWKLTNQLDYDQDATQASWHNFQKQVASAKRVGLDWLKVAASITVLAAITASMWFFGSTDISFTSHDAIQKHIFLDQTQITLNKNSTITSKDGYAETHRTVSLQGQAYFDVSKSQNAFRVETNAGDVVVYGTQFDVYTDSKITTVELHEGSVHFERNNKEIELTPGERLVLMDGLVSKSKIRTQLQWSDGIVCTDVPLAYILGQLKLNYPVDYDISHRCLKEHYTVSLPKDDLEACLLILKDVVGKNFALLDGRIVLD